MDRRTVNPWTWQEQLGYNQGHEVTGAERTLYLSGQGSIDDDGQLVHEGDMVGQLNKCIDNVETVLSESDMTLANVVRITVYTTDAVYQNAAALGRLNEAGSRQTMTLLGVSRLAYLEMLVELEVTAVA